MPPKKPSDETPSIISSKESKSLAKMSKDLIHEPNRPQEKMKARFWTRFAPGPMVTIENLSIEDLNRILGNTSMVKYWGNASFRDWFLDQGEERETVRFLFNRGLAALETILLNPEASPGAVVTAVKLLGEMSGFIQKNQQDKFADDDINKMSERELESYLEAKGVKFAHPVGIVDIEEED